MHDLVVSGDKPKASPGVPAQGLSRTTYDQLKQQVQQLKEEQKGLQRNKVKERELESAALLQQKQEYAEQLAEQAQELASLQQRLKDSLDRAGRVRLHNEKEKKALIVQVEKLEAALQDKDKQHQAAIQEARHQHALEVQELQEQLAQERNGRELDRQAFEFAKQGFMQEVEEWSQAEVEAVQHAAQQQVDAAQREASQRAQQCQILTAQLQEAAALAVGLRAQLAACEQLAAQERCGSEAEVARLQTQQRAMELQAQQQQDAATLGLAALQQQLQALQQEQSVQMRELKAKHALEMDHIQVKLQGVLAKKDATIAALRKELEAVTAQLQHTNALLAEQQQELLGDDDSHSSWSSGQRTHVVPNADSRRKG